MTTTLFNGVTIDVYLVNWLGSPLHQIDAYVRNFNTVRGFGREVNVWQAGSGDLVLDNRTGDFSPSNLDGAFVADGLTAVRPWQKITILANYDSETYDVATMYTQDWTESYVPVGDRGGDAIAAVTLADGQAKLPRTKGWPAPSPVGGGELSGARIERILTAASFNGPSDIDEGTVTMQATDLSADPVTEIQLVADSEGGAFWFEADGTAVFRDRHALLERARSITVQATFGDGGGAELPYSDLAVTYTGDSVVNYASYARVGGSEQVVVDDASHSMYGLARDVRSDLICETDGQALALAQWKLARYSEPEQRIESIVIQPRRDPAALFPVVLGLRVRDLVRVIRRPPSGSGHTITRECHVAGIRHMVTNDEWTTVLDLWSATPYLQLRSSFWDVGLWASGPDDSAPGVARWAV